jgi:tetratricopeptide (TPR) repeat protein
MTQCQICNQAAATHICPDCNLISCPTCIVEKRFGTDTLAVCAACGNPVTAYARSPKETREESPKTFKTIMGRILKRPQAVQPSSANEATRLLKEAQGLIHAQDLKEALAYLDRALTLEPYNVPVLETRFELLSRQQKTHDALNNGVSLVVACAKLNDSTRALNVYRRLISVEASIDPGAETLLKLADWLYERRQFQESATAYRKLAVLHPEHSDAPHAAYRCAYILNIELGNTPQAAKVYEFIIRSYPKSEYAAKARADLSHLTH